MTHTEIALKTGHAKLWVLLVGVSQYDDRRFPTLQYSTIDCQRLADAFVEVTAEFPHRSIDIFHDSAMPATHSAVRSRLQEVAEQARPEDTVLFYFCGHGVLEPRLQQAVFAVVDTQKDALLQTGLSAIGLLGLLGQCAATQQIVWLDFCHANGMSVDPEHQSELLDNPAWQMIEMLRQRSLQNSGFQALLSCDRAQQSWKFPELGHGIFTHFLIEGLRGGAATPEGLINATVLANFVHDRTVQYIDHTNQQLEWLHRDAGDRALKANTYPCSGAIAQTPLRIAAGQTPVPLGIKPKDPLEMIFPDINTTDIEPPLDRVSPIRQPAPRSSKPELPPLFNQPVVEVEASPQVTVPEIVPPIPIEEPLQAKAPEPILPQIEKPVTRIPAPELVSEPPQLKVPEPSPPKIEKPVAWIPVPEPEPPQAKVPKPVPEPPQAKSPESILPIEKPVAPIPVPEPEPPQAKSPEPIPLLEPPTRSINAAIPVSTKPEPKLPEIKTIEPVIPEPRRIDPPQPVAVPQRRSVNSAKRQVEQFRQTVRQQLQHTSIALTQFSQQLQHTAIALEQFKQTAHHFVIDQQTLNKIRIVQARKTLQTKLSEVSQSTRQAAQTGQAIYQQRSVEVSHQASANVQRLNHATRQITAASVQRLNHTAGQIRRTTIERASRPQTRKRLIAAFGGLGILALGAAGVSLYQSREQQMNDVVALSGTSATQLAGSQTSEALVSAIRAGRTLQQLDRSWNLIPESLKITTIATLQQAIAFNQSAIPSLRNRVTAANFSSDQKTFAVVTANNTIQLWQRQNNTLQPLNVEFKGHRAAITQLVFSPDGKRLASASDDQTIKLWDVERRILIQTLAAHKQAVTALSFRSDGEVLASGSADQTIKLWGVASGKILDTFKGHTATVSVIRFSPDGRVLAAGTTTNTIHLWYPDSPNPILLGRHSSAQQGISDLAFSPDGNSIASAGLDRTVKLWTVKEAKPDREASPVQTLTGHTDGVTSLSISPTGKILASGSQDRTIRLWNLQTGALLKTLVGHQDKINAIAFTPDGTALISVSDQNGLVRWNFDLTALMSQGCELARSSGVCN